MDSNGIPFESPRKRVSYTSDARFRRFMTVMFGFGHVERYRDGDNEIPTIFTRCDYIQFEEIKNYYYALKAYFRRARLTP